MFTMTPKMLEMERRTRLAGARMCSNTAGRGYETAAYDAAGGLGEDIVEKLVEFLRDKLDPSDVAELSTLLTGGIAADEPPPFPGRPSPGGAVAALDSLPPHLQRVALDKMAPQVRAYAVDALADEQTARARAFAARFPDAARIGVL